MSQAVYILGGAQTDFSRNWAREGLEIYDMFAETLREGIDAAGIEPAQIEVGHVGNFVGDLFTGQGLLGGFFGQVYPELASLPTSRHEAACASGSIAVLSAMRDIEAGHYQVACVLGLELMRNVDGKTGAEHLGAARWLGHEANSADFPWPHMFDRIAREYDQRYGIDSDHLNRIAEINFGNAKRNPNAQTRGWNFPEGCFSSNDELNPVIDGSVRKMDCGQITDGAACVILAGEGRRPGPCREARPEAGRYTKNQGLGAPLRSHTARNQVAIVKGSAPAIPSREGHPRRCLAAGRVFFSGRTGRTGDSRLLHRDRVHGNRSLRPDRPRRELESSE
jgi:acetyl-CoA C-acetyltransferase